MTKINDGGPAFPNITPDMCIQGGPGMSKRDWFAGQAMAGWLASFGPDDGYRAAGIADFAYEIADAMIARSGGQDDE